MKTGLLSLLLLSFCIPVFSQTLFTYGNKPVSKMEFVNAFDKNPSADTMSRANALRSYLNLYINYKLKVQAAHDEKLDVTDEYRSDRDRFKMDMAETAINNEANISSLVQEAFQRSRRDIELAQVFIPMLPGSDTTEFYKKISEAYSQLKSGKSFNDVVSQYTQDPAAKNNGGNIGYITVFTLPYEAENMVYTLKPGEYSKPYRSRLGYHIFKEISERPALGTRKVQYVLFPLSPTPSEAEKTATRQLADSVYKLISDGASFADIQATFGTRKGGGQTTADVSVGQYDAAFENAVYELQKEGDVSKPFYTPYGCNIIRLIEKKPVTTDTSDITIKALMQEKVSADDRLSFAKKNLEKKWLQTTGYKPGTYKPDDLRAYTDSMIETGKAPAHAGTLNNNTVLFSFTGKKVTPDDWMRYVQMRMQPNNATPDYKALMPQFINYTTANYYKDHIGQFHPELKPQLDEFNDANLLFAAMDRHVWSKASTDTVGLLQYYKAHKQNYTWQPGADAIVVTANNKQVADEMLQKIKEHPSGWHSLVNSYGSLAQADSSRFEYDQLPVKNTTGIKAGYTSEPATVNDGNGYTFVYITAIHPQTEPRSFDDARGMVINDYQQVVEAKWIADLKKKYPVKVNEIVFKSIR